MYFDIYGNPTKPKSASLILPMFLVLVASGGGNYWLWKERARLTGEVNAATAKLALAEAAHKEMAEKLEKLETERDTLVEARDQALKDAQAKAAELAKLKDDGTGAGADEGSQPEGAGNKAKPEAKADSKADAKAETKAETKSETKSAAKEKPKAKPKKKTADAPRRPKADGASKAPVEREL